MKITKGKLKQIIMEEITYLEQDMINVPGLYSVSPEQLKANVVGMLTELTRNIEEGEYERVLSILTNPDKMEIMTTKIKALADNGAGNEEI
tara:strand:+ start:276 stop:548 length:273 start_codon:yes stop_codon:yes gene_type:complete